ncbi:hypothetical protein H6504_04335 [Candidatus Woesearchaeota archaeon]|nr:hypothetical protein [Candidatus Woesearchaeota archaeon]
MAKPRNGISHRLFSLGSQFYALNLYTQSRIIRRPGAQFSGLLVCDEPVAFTSYDSLKRSGYVSTYLLQGGAADLHGLRNAPVQQIKQNDALYSAKIAHVALEELTDGVITAITCDIAAYVGGEGQSTLEARVVERVRVQPEIVVVNSGAHGMVRGGKGIYHDICPIDIGIDGMMGCTATITPDGTYDPEGRCDYCYAYGRNALPSLHTLYETSKLVDLIEEKIAQREINGRVFLRIGQNVETFIPREFREKYGLPNQLHAVLDAVIELRSRYDIDVTMPTKMPEFDVETADLLREARVSLLASVGYEVLEQGILKHGFDTRRRLDELLRFADADVQCGIYVATDITRPMSEMQDEAKYAVAFQLSHPKLGLQYLDMRIRNKKSLAPAISGQVWDELKCVDEDLFGNRSAWRKKGQFFVASKTHPDFLRYRNEREGDIRLCSTHVGKDEQSCGLCFVDRVKK